MGTLAAMLLWAAIPRKKSVFAGEAFPWIKAEAPENNALKKCLARGPRRIGGMTFLAANL